MSCRSTHPCTAMSTEGDCSAKRTSGRLQEGQTCRRRATFADVLVEKSACDSHPASLMLDPLADCFIPSSTPTCVCSVPWVFGFPPWQHCLSATVNSVSRDSCDVLSPLLEKTALGAPCLPSLVRTTQISAGSIAQSDCGMLTLSLVVGMLP